MRAPGTPRSHPRASAYVLAALVLLAVAAAPVRAAATGSIGLRLLDAPITDDPRARLYIVDHLSPGTVIKRRIELSNTWDGNAHVLVYAAAARIENGSFLGAAGHTPNELSTWTSVSSPEVNIPPKDGVEMTVTINVPEDAQPGEHYGAIWAEARSSDDVGIVQVNRVGIRIYLSVGAGGAPAADFTVDSLTAQRSDQGRPMIVATVHNTGGRALDVNGDLKLSDGPGGLSAGPFPATLGSTLAIGARGSVTILLDDQVPAGPWDAQLILKSGLLERTAHAVITFPAAGSALPVETSSDGSRWLLFILAFAFLVVGITTFVLIRRARNLRRLRLALT
jgi:hypothetical protein